jgi:hypothetical protein
MVQLLPEKQHMLLSMCVIEIKSIKECDMKSISLERAHSHDLTRTFSSRHLITGTGVPPWSKRFLRSAQFFIWPPISICLRHDPLFLATVTLRIAASLKFFDFFWEILNCCLNEFNAGCDIHLFPVSDSKGSVESSRECSFCEIDQTVILRSVTLIWVDVDFREVQSRIIDYKTFSWMAATTSMVSCIELTHNSTKNSLWTPWICHLGRDSIFDDFGWIMFPFLRFDYHSKCIHLSTHFPSKSKVDALTKVATEDLWDIIYTKWGTSIIISQKVLDCQAYSWPSRQSFGKKRVSSVSLEQRTRTLF